MNRILPVWWDGERVGALTQDRSGAISFAYDDAWRTDPTKPALSQSLQKQSAPFPQKLCEPFFSGLLPDENQRRLLAGRLGVSEANFFSILAEVGVDVAGAIAVCKQPPATEPLAPEVLPTSRLLQELDRLPTHPMLAGDPEGLRLSLAGAQSKLPVLLVDGRIALGQPTTHILKPPIPAYPGTTENEAFVMRLAKACGLNAADVEPRYVGDKKFLLITRYDRELTPDGAIKRLHQEDLCQALGILPQRKYVRDGGPAFKRCFELIRAASSAPAADVLALVDAALFNIIVGNADAHAKNFSLLYRSSQARLAPLYDLLSTVQIKALNPEFAMKFGGAARLDDIDGDSFDRFAKDSRVNRTQILKRAQELCARVMDKTRDVADALPVPEDTRVTVDVLSADVRRRADLLQTKVLTIAATGRRPRAKKELVATLRVDEGQDMRRVWLDIENRTGTLITDLSASVRNVTPSLRYAGGFIIAANRTLKAAKSLSILLLTQDRPEAGMIFQHEGRENFGQPNERGRINFGNTDPLFGAHTFDLVIQSDEEDFNRILCCEVAMDGAGRMTVQTI